VNVVPVVGTSSWFYRAPGVLVRDVGDEVALAPPGHTDIILLAGPAARVWTMLDGPRTFAELVERLATTDLPAHDVSIQEVYEELLL
jgi:hypothetical protein